MSGATSDLVSLPTDPKPAADDYPYTLKCYVGCTWDDLSSDASKCSGGATGVADGYAASALAGWVRANDGTVTRHDANDGRGGRGRMAWWTGEGGGGCCVVKRHPALIATRRRRARARASCRESRARRSPPPPNDLRAARCTMHRRRAPSRAGTRTSTSARPRARSCAAPRATRGRFKGDATREGVSQAPRGDDGASIHLLGDSADAESEGENAAASLLASRRPNHHRH